jgi:Zn-dependent M28 family amino/carboxypeptidase
MNRVACIFLAAFSAAALVAQQHPAFSGAAALEFTRKAVAFGPRPPGSEAIHKLQTYIHAELKPLGCEVIDDNFRASTPLGPIPMRNIIARFRGNSSRIVAVTGHYDTKMMPGTYFVGANDGGSSTGFLLELARVLSHTPHKDDIWLVWFDGEEAFVQFTDTDGLYGSRRLANEWLSDGTLAKLKALINVDMIGDRDLMLENEKQSTEWLRRLVWDSAARLGMSKHLQTDAYPILDDHIPFLKAGASAVDVIDLDYGPDNSYWHTDKDTMDKLSAESLDIVGRIVLATIGKL